MIMKKAILFFTCMLFISIIPLSAQIVQHGLVLNGGIGQAKSKLDRSNAEWEDITYEFGASVGYRLRFNMPAARSFHYDLDVSAGTKAKNFYENYTTIHDGGIHTVGQRSFSTDPVISIGATANYSLVFVNI